MYYIDIETVPAFKNFYEADDRTKKLFKTKFFREIKESDKGGASEDEIASNLYAEKAGVLAEFNKIVCVSLGVILPKYAELNGTITPERIYIKSFASEDEKDILVALADVLNKNYEQLCAHFGKGFDYPVLARKYVIHQIPLPQVLNISGMKPWEVPLHDTQDMWKFGDMRHSVSLDLLSHIFGLPSPKEEMHGSEVSHYYYNVPDGLAKIVKYCEADVRTLINVHRVMNYLPVLK